MGTHKAVERRGKDSGMATGILGLVAYCCARWCFCMDGSFVHIKTPLGKALAKRGNRLAGKWWGSTGSPTENLYLDNCLKKRLQRQWYGMLKENALLGNFQHAPQTHYKCLPMKLKCFWCVLRIWRLPKVFSSVWNTTVCGDESDCIASILRLRSGTNKQQYSGCRNWINPETHCTIFLHP